MSCKYTFFYIEREQYHLDRLKPEYNIAKHAGYVLRLNRTEASIEAIRKHKLGVPRTEQEKLSIANSSPNASSVAVTEIETGTRVGLATGPIYPLNIGKEEFEVTFIGDKINFAARLEKNCDVNGILMSNRFFHKLDDSNHDFIDKVEKTEKK
ncbi:MAG: hypothetical protein EOP34_07825, partial [Rickettsiales bacterium]